MLGRQGKGKAHGHALWDVVQRHRENQQGGALPRGGVPLWLVGAQVEVGHHRVQGHEKAHPQKKAPRRGQPARNTLAFRLLNGGDQQAPHRGSHHHAGGKAQENPLGPLCYALTEEKDHRGPQDGHQTGKARPGGGPQYWLHSNPSSLLVMLT